MTVDMYATLFMFVNRIRTQNMSGECLQAFSPGRGVSLTCKFVCIYEYELLNMKTTLSCVVDIYV